MAYHRVSALFSRRGKFRRHVRQGDQARADRQWVEAARQYGLALALQPDMAAIWVQLGHALKESGDYPGAERSYRRAAALAPHDADIALQMGHLSTLLGQIADADDHYRRALALGSDDPHAQRPLEEGSPMPPPPASMHGGDTLVSLAAGDAARERRQWELAAEHYRDHLASHPRDSGIWVQLGHSFKEAGNHARAKMAYLQARELTPDDADLHVQIGHLYADDGREDEALRHYRRAVELGSNDRLAQSLVARSFRAGFSSFEAAGAASEQGAPSSPFRRRVSEARIEAILATFASMVCPTPAHYAQAIPALAACRDILGRADSMFDLWLLVNRLDERGVAARGFYSVALATPELFLQAPSLGAALHLHPQDALEGALRSPATVSSHNGDMTALKKAAWQRVLGHAPAELDTEDLSEVDHTTELVVAANHLGADTAARQLIALHAWGRTFGDIVLWLLRDGYRTDAALRAVLPPEWLKAFAQSFAVPERWRGILTGPMALLWASDDSVQTRFSLDDSASRDQYVGWFRVHGLRDLRAMLFASPAERRFLLGPDHHLLGLSRLVADIWRTRPDLRRRFDAGSTDGRLELLCWYRLQGAAEYNSDESLTETEAAYVAATSEPGGATGEGLAPLAQAAWRASSDLQNRFPLDKPAQRSAFSAWFTKVGTKQIMKVGSL